MQNVSKTVELFDWTALSPPWQAAFEETWTSWNDGNFGIGAALWNPQDESIVVTGRNAVDSDPSGQLRLHGNWMAHAEMNMFADMGPFTAKGLHFYTTLEPCLMCAATAIFLNVEHVWFAAHDEYFEQLDELWDAHPYTAARKPSSTHAFTGKLASFARLLPLSFTFENRPGSHMVEQAERLRPKLAALSATRIAYDRRDQGHSSVATAIATVWDTLPPDDVS